MKNLINQHLLNWYQKNKKSWPWRDFPEPYLVWVSEIMAQQTRLSTVLPYFHRWMKGFPTIADLANASEQEVLIIWEGLGYYARARNLHKAAKKIMSDFDGQIPNNIIDLQSLPGIGAYTAGAIASIAFGKNESVVDGNVKRVLARVFQISTEINTPKGTKEIWAIADSLIPNGNAGDFNQSIMELGAFVCKPTAPNCNNCPINQQCISYKTGTQNEYPKKKKKTKVPHFIVSAAVFKKEDSYLICQRPEKGLLAGMWEFPGGKLESGESHEEALIREIKEELDTKVKIGEKIGTYKHAYTHFKVTLDAFFIDRFSVEPIGLEGQEVKWVKINQLQDFPMGKIDRDISNTLINNAKK